MYTTLSEISLFYRIFFKLRLDLTIGRPVTRWRPGRPGPTWTLACWTLR